MIAGVIPPAQSGPNEVFSGDAKMFVEGEHGCEESDVSDLLPVGQNAGEGSCSGRNEREARSPRFRDLDQSISNFRSAKPRI